MRVGGPACKHGCSDEDVRHAVRNAIREISMDEDLTMLIGPDTAGRFLEVGVLDLEGDDPVAVHAMVLRPAFYPFL